MGTPQKGFKPRNTHSVICVWEDPAGGKEDVRGTSVGIERPIRKPFQQPRGERQGPQLRQQQCGWERGKRQEFFQFEEEGRTDWIFYIHFKSLNF